MQSRSPEVASSVLSNCYTRICFRLGDSDAEKFASGFSFFDSKALQNLGVGEAIARIERSEYDFNLLVERVPKVDQKTAELRREAITKNTRENFARTKAEVEAELFVETFSASKEAESKEHKKGSKQTKEDSEKIYSQGSQEPTTDKQQPDKSLANPESQSTTESSKEENTHRYLQNILKRIGGDNGFVVTLEQQVFGGIGRVDVVLENESFRIACEIANTNSTQYEIQNIQKCLAAGFDKVIVVSNGKKHLSNIRRIAETVISEDLLSNVHFLEPEHFHLFLEKLNSGANTDSKDEKVKGYTVNVSFKETTKTDRESREKTIAEILENAEDRKNS